jgi:two-component system, LytTR family, sensor kinase
VAATNLGIPSPDGAEDGGPIASRPIASRWRRPGALYVAFALLFGAYMGLNQAIGLRFARPAFALWKPFVWEFSSVLVIFAMIPLIVRLERRFALDGRPRGRILAAHIGGAVAFSIIHVAGIVVIRKLAYAFAGESYDFGNVFVGGLYELQKDIITYLVILIIIFAVREFRVRRAGEMHAVELAAELATAKLRHLTAQIEPHFLFNSLNAISNRMREDVDAADRMISHLGDLLRAAYDTDDQVIVPLGRELEWLRGYTAMMSERFRGQLDFELDVEPGLEAVGVPRLLLQPIVENALKHGLGDGHGWLSVDVRRVAAHLRYTISDDGVGLPELPLTHGTGLSNVLRRLQLLFPNGHVLGFAARLPRGTVVTVSFPVQE